MSFEYNYKQGDTVTFDNGRVSGVGIIKGSSSSPIPVLGTGYIVEVIRSIPELPNEVYPFDHIVVFENTLK